MKVKRPQNIWVTALPNARLQGPAASAITPPFTARLHQGLPWRRKQLNSEHPLKDNCLASTSRPRGPLAPYRADEESKMPKLKTKSGAKKRFKITATGKVKYQQAGKRHGMIKRTTKQIRDHRGTSVLFKTDGDNVKKYWMPNG
jgi:large subunit ribosomal protein L35